MDEERYIDNESTPTTEATPPQSDPTFSKENVTAGAEQLKSRLKGALNRKTLISVALALVILIGAIVGIRYAKNNYMTPIRAMEKEYNQRTTNSRKSMQSDIQKLGVSSGHARNIVNVLRKSNGFLDLWADDDDLFAEGYEYRQDNYGDNFKITYTVEDKIKLENSDLRDYQEQYRKWVKTITSDLAETEDFDADDWGDFADAVDLTRAQAKKLVQALEKGINDIERTEVTAGYELNVVKTITGDALDEPKETSGTIRVIKVNGRWILAEVMYCTEGDFIKGTDFNIYLLNIDYYHYYY